MRSVWTVLAVLATFPLWAEEPAWIGAPEQGVTLVDEKGAVQEDWGSFGVEIQGPEEPQRISQRVSRRPAPHVETRWKIGDVSLVLDAFRAPIWPSGVDVLSAKVERETAPSASVGPVELVLSLALPENLDLGERVGVVGGRQVMALPEEPSPVRVKRHWGCRGGVVAMPGWGRPNKDCDPAFKNISAGMGGVPIEYEFRVPVSSQRTVFLGFCESHWDWPGRRPLTLSVEGADRLPLDPVALWGKHGSGCVRFDAWDADGNGRLNVQVLPHPDATDKNTILNAIWIFPRDRSVQTDDVMRGLANDKAEYYVDVGGKNDQMLYEPGSVTFHLDLNPGESMNLPFLLACGGNSLASTSLEAWRLDSLAHAADRVCQGSVEMRGALSLSPRLQDPWCGALLLPLAIRRQDNGFYILPQGMQGGSPVSFHELAYVTSALDRVGYTWEAERLLRVLIDVPVPDAFSSCSQGKDGMWDDGASSASGHAWALLALANHGLLSRDLDWLERTWEPMRRGGEWLLQEEHIGSSDREEVAGVSLLALGKSAALLGDSSSCERFSQKGRAIAGERDGPVDWREAPLSDLASVGWFHELADCLIGVEEDKVSVLPAFPARYLVDGGMRLPRLCTEKGKIDLEVTCSPSETRVVLRPETGWANVEWMVYPPSGVAPVKRATVNGEPVALSQDGGVRLLETPSLLETVFHH